MRTMPKNHFGDDPETELRTMSKNLLADDPVTELPTMSKNLFADDLVADLPTMYNNLLAPIPDDLVTEFTLVGLASSPKFQVCLTCIETLHAKYPKLYPKPYIRPMLELDWGEYLTKVQRKFGGRFWCLSKPFVVYANNKYLGDDEDLDAFVGRRLQLKLPRDYSCLAKMGMLDIYKKYLEIGRKFVYLTVSVDHHVIGNMVFMLYAELVPRTCKQFIKKCKKKKNGYKGTQIHRIMGKTWIQFADYTLPPRSRSCENYKVPHNRRGILSMCNDGRHINNATQFIVCLNPTPWMDYRYVAFGQLMQGNEVLMQLEEMPTCYEHPQPHILNIADAGEITLDDTVDVKMIEGIHKYIEERDKRAPQRAQEIVRDPRDTASVLFEANYKAGDYFCDDDHVSHIPMKNLPKHLLSPVSYISVNTSFTAEEEQDADEYSLFVRKISYGLPEEIVDGVMSVGKGGSTKDKLRVSYDSKIGSYNEIPYTIHDEGG